MLFSVSVIAAGLLMIMARFLTRDQGGLSRAVIAIAILLPPVALATSSFLGHAEDRERIDVQFVGYRVPMSRVEACGNPAKNLTNAKGVWIGGGRRWPDDTSADTISLPGYRGHLAEVCTDVRSGSLVLRQIHPGETWYQLPPRKPAEEPRWGLQQVNDVDTQRLVIRGAPDGAARRCVAYSGKSIPVSSLTAFAEHERKAAVRAAPARGLREGLLKRFRPWAKDSDVACVDIASGAPAKCAARLTATAAPVLVWPTRERIEGGWQVLPPPGATWDDCQGGHAAGADQSTTIDPGQVSLRSSWREWKRSADRVSLRMITGRTVGGVADQTVPIASSEFDPFPLRLGTRYELGFVRMAQELVIIVEDPSVQLRISDLYGAPTLDVKEGEFSLTFQSPSGENLLVADLSSPTDHLAPKTIFEHVQARVTVPREGDTFSLAADGRPAQKQRFNDVFTLDTSRDTAAVRPLLLIRRVQAPAMTYLLPLFAALLAIGATFLDQTAAPLLPARWLSAPLLLAFLDMRYALSTRWLLNEYSSDDASRTWVVNGAFLLIGPPIVMLAAALLQPARVGAARRPTADLYAVPKPAPAARLPWKVAAGKATALLAARLQDRRVLPILAWLCIAAPSAITWILLAGGERPDPRAALAKAAATPAVAFVAAALGWIAFRAAARLANQGTGNDNPFGFTRGKPGLRERLSGSLLTRALLVAVAAIALRSLTYLLGSQEQLPGGIRADVLSIPITAGILAAFTRSGDAGPTAWRRFIALGALFLTLFGVAGLVMNDFGLLWVGGMAFVLALPAAVGDHLYAYLAAALLFLALFISPIVAPRPFRDALRLAFGGRQEIGTGPTSIRFTDELQVSRSRDYYRLIDANQPDAVMAIPSQVAREVAIERERVRYQSLDGAWREAFRSTAVPHSQWTGAGFLAGRAVVGDPTFTRAARSDYVLPTYLRAEFGSMGLLAALTLYLSLFIHGAVGAIDRPVPRKLALWSAAIAAGTGFFMLGGTTGIFPFSGKWPLFFSFASSSDIALGLALLMLALVEGE